MLALGYISNKALFRTCHHYALPQDYNINALELKIRKLILFNANFVMLILHFAFVFLLF